MAKDKKRKSFSFSAKNFIVNYYIPRYKDIFGFKPLISWAKDMRLLRKLCKDFYEISLQMGFKTTEDFLISFCEKYFKIQEGLPKKSGFSIGVFYLTLPKLIIEKNDNKGNIKEKIEIINKGFKLAYLNYFNEGYMDDFPYESRQGIFNKIYDFLFELKTNNQIFEKFDFEIIIELYFLYVFNLKHMQQQVIFNYLYSQKIIESFKIWLNSEEGKECIFFMPKKKIIKNKNVNLNTETSIMENFILLYTGDRDQKIKFKNWLLNFNGTDENLAKQLLQQITKMNLLTEFRSLNKKS